MEAFWNWLIEERGAAWVIGVLGLLFTVYTYRKQTAPPKVIVRRLEVRNLLSIHSSQAGKLKVTYNSGNEAVEIDNLRQSVFVIYNDSNKDISEAVKLSILFDEPAEEGSIWRVEFEGTIECCHKGKMEEDGRVAGIEVEFPYINAYKTHNSYTKMYFISDGTVNIQYAIGEGKGWTVDYKTQEAEEQFIEDILSKIGLVASAIFVLSLFLGMVYASVAVFPASAVFFNPSDENIEATLEHYRRTFEALRDYGYVEYFKVYFGPIWPWMIGYFVVLMLLAPLAALGEYLLSRVVEYVSSRRASRFD
jgi:NADH:ubiquinone oxidoreductase subunit 3 (subunit A)